MRKENDVVTTTRHTVHCVYTHVGDQRLKIYYSYFRFGTFLGLAHAAMTAEGDNSVLMQKVAKERLGIIAKNPLKVEKPESSDITDNKYLVYLIQAREEKLFNELGKPIF